MGKTEETLFLLFLIVEDYYTLTKCINMGDHQNRTAELPKTQSQIQKTNQRKQDTQGTSWFYDRTKTKCACHLSKYKWV